MIHDMIRYMIQKNKKLIHDMIHVLTTIIFNYMIIKAIRIGN